MPCSVMNSSETPEVSGWEGDFHDDRAEIAILRARVKQLVMMPRMFIGDSVHAPEA